MAKQNIYDNETFFEGYKNLRNKAANANNLFEIPAMLSLLPDLKGLKILDLGCGFGEHCMEYVKMGAEKVVGVDISKKMLEVAKEENSHEKITYINMAMEDIANIDEKFDVVISSLAFHYVEDFEGVVKTIYDKLSDDGLFIYSQENPLSTSYSGGDRWERDDDGKKIYLKVSNYGVEAEYESEWFVDGIKRYHRMFSTIVNTLAGTGFFIEKMVEPLPTDEILNEYPDYYDLYHRPDFLLVKSRKLKIK